MNQQQIRHAKARIEAIRDSKIKRLNLEKPSNNYGGVNKVLEKVNPTVGEPLEDEGVAMILGDCDAALEALRVKQVEDRADQIVDVKLVSNGGNVEANLRAFELEQI